jgi:hypothetical protein
MGCGGLGSGRDVVNEGTNLRHQRVRNLRQAVAFARVNGNGGKDGVIGVVVEHGGAPGNDIAATESLHGSTSQIW